MRAGPRIVRLQGDRRCVYLIENDVRRWIPDPQTLESIRRGQDVEELTLEELKNLSRGEPVTSVVQPDGRRGVQLHGRNEAYLLEDGKRRWIPDPTTLEFVVGWNSVEELFSEEELEAFPLGEPFERAVSPSIGVKDMGRRQKRGGVPSDLASQLRDVLLDCGPFGDDADLSAVFAHAKLRPWLHSVPQAHNPAARADRVVAFLIEKHRSDTKENALVLLLRVLSERLDVADECHQRLVMLAAELERALAGGISANQPVRSMNAASRQPYIASAEIIVEIKELVKADQFAKALARMARLEVDQDDVDLLTGRLHRVQQQERRGTITRSDANAERTRIAEAILDLVPQ